MLVVKQGCQTMHDQDFNTALAIGVICLLSGSRCLSGSKNQPNQYACFKVIANAIAKISRAEKPF